MEKRNPADQLANELDKDEGFQKMMEVACSSWPRQIPSTSPDAWDDVEIPKEGWHIRKLQGNGPVCLRLFHNGKIVGGVQKLDFSIDAKSMMPKMSIEVIMLNKDTVSIDMGNGEVVEQKIKKLDPSK